MTAPIAVLIGGAPATGKSTLATSLAPRLGAAVLDLDVATGPLTAVVGDLIGVTDLGDPRMAALTRGPRYDTLYALAEDQLRAGLSVVLVAPFTAERAPAGWTAAAHRLAAHAGRLTLVWLHLPPHELVARLHRRDAARDAEKVRDPAAYLASLDHLPPAVPHLSLDATAPVAELVESVLVHISRPSLAIDGTG
jgi:predicted kinase